MYCYSNLWTNKWVGVTAHGKNRRLEGSTEIGNWAQDLQGKDKETWQTIARIDKVDLGIIGTLAGINIIGSTLREGKW